MEVSVESPKGSQTIAYVALALTLVGSLLAGSMRFQAVETRLGQVEMAQGETAHKLDSIVDSLRRIEGRLAEQDRAIDRADRKAAGR